MSENVNLEAAKASLRNAPWRKVKEITIDGAAGPVTLWVRKPPIEAMAKLSDDWKKRGVVDEKGSPTSTDEGLVMTRELLARVLFWPNAVRPLFSPDELVDVAWVDDVRDEVLAAISTAKAVESAKGN